MIGNESGNSKEDVFTYPNNTLEKLIGIGKRGREQILIILSRTEPEMAFDGALLSWP